MEDKNWRDTLERRPADLSESAVAERPDEANQDVLAAVPALMDEKYSLKPEFKPVTVTNETVQLEQPVVVAGTGAGSEPDAGTSAILIADTLARLTFWPGHFSANELADLHQLCDAELTKRDAAAYGGQKYLDATWHERGELPPIGAVCEHKSARSAKYSKVFVVGHGELFGVKVAFYARSNNDENFTCSSAEYFRPTRTERDELMDIIRSAEHPLDDVDVRVAQATLADAILAAGFKREGGAK